MGASRRKPVLPRRTVRWLESRRESRSNRDWRNLRWCSRAADWCRLIVDGATKTGDGVPAGGSAVVGRPDLFISYAREDSAFVHQLDEALEEREKVVWVDWQDIRPSADWRAKIEAGIRRRRLSWRRRVRAKLLARRGEFGEAERLAREAHRLASRDAHLPR